MVRRRQRLRRNKRGSLDDLIFIITSLLVISICILVGFKITNAFKTQVNDVQNVTDSHGRQAVNQINDIYHTSVDNGFLLLMVGLMIVSLVLASLVIVHPIFLLFYILLMSVAILFGGIASNIYTQMANSPEFADLASQLLWTGHIMRFLPIIIGIFGAILAIVMYRNWQGRQ